MAALLSRVLPVAWTALIVLLIPLQAVLTRRLLLRRRPSPMRAYASTARGLAIVGLVTLAIDLAGPRAGVLTVTARLPWPSLLAWAAATWAACVTAALAALWARRAPRRPLDPGATAMLPTTPRERLALFGISALAGLVEEYVMRGFCLAVLVALLHSLPIAFVLVAASFGLAHGYQGRISMLRATAQGALLAVPVVATGSIVPSMIAHAATNLVSGAWTRTLARRWGIADAAPEGTR